MDRQLRRTIFVVALLAMSGPVHAAGLHDQDNSPFAVVFGFPRGDDSGQSLASGQQVWTSTISVSSHDIEDIRDGEVLRLDGETTRLSLRFRHAFSDSFDVDLELPYLWHESGGLDTWIESWHDTFGLPDGLRKERPNDQLEFYYADANGNLIDISRNVRGPGDVRVSAGWQFENTLPRRTAVRLALKIPTGDSELALGSGSTDLSLGVVREYHRIWGVQDLGGTVALHLTRIGRPEFLPDRYKKLVGQLAFGFRYQINPALDVLAQARVRSPIYDSDIENLGEISVAATFGADIQLSDELSLVLALGEDLKSSSGPDVTFLAGIRYARD